MNNINIKIMGRMDAMEYTYIAKEPTIIISISEHGTPNIIIDETNQNIKDVLHLKFDDIEHQVKGFKLMDSGQALKIKNFIDKYKNSNIKTILVHCHAGVSRSAAVACAISKYIKGDDTYIWKSGQYHPNKHCYNLCLEAFGLDKLVS